MNESHYHSDMYASGAHPGISSYNARRGQSAENSGVERYSSGVGNNRESSAYSRDGGGISFAPGSQSDYHRDMYASRTRPGVSPRCAQSAGNSRVESCSPGVERDAHSQGGGDSALPIIDLVVAIIGLGNIGIGSAGLYISTAMLRLATATAYYGVAGATGYAAFQGSRYTVQQAQPGVFATIRAANSAARQVQARAIAINAAALHAAIAAQSSIVAGTDAIVDGSNVVRSQVVDGTTAIFRTASNSVHGSLTRHPEVRQESVPVEILSQEEAQTWSINHLNDGIDRLEEQQLDDETLVLSRVHHEDPAVLNTVEGPAAPNAVEGVLDSDILSSCPEILQGEVELMTVEEACTRITENPDEPMYYFEEQQSADGRGSIW